MLKIKYIKVNPKGILPTQAPNGDNAGYDLYSPTYLKIAPFERKLIPIGFKMEIPDGYYGKICPRSGLALKNGIDVMAGTIDASYRDEIGVVLINHNGAGLLGKILMSIHLNNTNNLSLDKFFGAEGSLEIKEGDKIAQIIFRKKEDVEFEEVTQLSPSQRIGGFGSTGR